MEIVLALAMLAGGICAGTAIGWLWRGSRTSSGAANQEAELARQELKHQQEMQETKTEAANLKGQLEQAATAQQIVEQAKAQLAESVKQTATQALQENNRHFIELSEQTLGKTMEQAKSEIENRHTRFQELVKPLAENYSQLAPRIESLTAVSQTLAGETGKLSSALTDVRAVGNWGEVQLRRVVEMAQMTPYCDFTEQTATSSDDRPDLLVRLPESKTIVVDAKASLAAAMEANAAESEEVAEAAWRKHAGALKNQVTSLSNKNYGRNVEGSLDFVVMFVPGDQFLASALRSDPDLVNYAMSRRVAITTPASLVSLLWAVHSGWQNWEIAGHAEEIRRAGAELHERLITFLKHYATLQNRLGQTVQAFNQATGTLESRVLVSARRMSEMRALDPSEIPEAKPMEELPRELRNTLKSEENSD